MSLSDDFYRPQPRPHLHENDYSYLKFRRMVIFFDEWLTYGLLSYLWYHQEETNPAIMGTVTAFAAAFNLAGYYHLDKLERKFNIVET